MSDENLLGDEEIEIEEDENYTDLRDDVMTENEETDEEDEDPQGELDGVEGEPGPEVEILDEVVGSVRCTLAKVSLVYGKNDRIQVLCSTVRRRDIGCALTKMADAVVRITEPPRGVPRPVIEAFGEITSITEVAGKKNPRIKINIVCDGLEEGAIDAFNKLAQTVPPDILLVPTQQELAGTEPTENG